MYEIIGIIICAAFFARLGKESKVPGFVWAIISVVCWLIGSYFLILIGGFIAQVILFFVITIIRCMTAGDMTGGQVKPASADSTAVSENTMAQNMVRHDPPAPPPVPVPETPAEKWWVGKANKEQLGPVDLETLKGWISSGQTAATDLVYTKRLAKWTPANQVPDLADQFPPK